MDSPHFEHVEAAIDRAAQAPPAVSPAPDWRPLEALLGPALIGQFMAMGEATAPDGTRVMLYKHGMTRRYLNVSADLRTWQYCNATYRPQSLAAALLNAFTNAEDYGALPSVAYDADFRAKRDAALAAAGYRVITAQPGRGVA